MSNINGRPSRLVLIRHAESARNKAKQGSIYFPDDESRQHVKGIADHKIDITPKGVLQAKAAGIFLREFIGVPDLLYDSEYLRTKKTADHILEAYPEPTRSLIKRRSTIYTRERDSGYTYDMTEEEVNKHFPYFKEYWKTVGPFFAVPPGGESMAKAVERIRTFLFEIYQSRDDQTVFVVGHGGTIRCFRYVIEHWTPEIFEQNPGPDNCGITVYEQVMAPTTQNGSLTRRKKLELKVFNSTEWKLVAPVLNTTF